MKAKSKASRVGKEEILNLATKRSYRHENGKVQVLNSEKNYTKQVD